MKTIEPGAVLLYYDGAQIFEGRDPIGGHYIAMMIDTVANGDFRYVATGAKPERLRQFRVGEMSLRELFLDAPGGEWFFIDGDPLYEEPLTLLPQEGALAERDDLLPGHFRMRGAPVDDLAHQRAIESNRTAMEFSIEPPETAHGHRVRLDTLIDVLVEIRTMVRHAYLSATRHLPDPNKDGHLMDVVAHAAPGSYRVILEAAAPIGQMALPLLDEPGDLVKGLERMDEVFKNAQDPDKAQEIFLDHEESLEKAYIRLLRILADKDTGFNYSWADPLILQTHYGGVSAAVAKKLYGTLSESVELRTEEVEIEGKFARVNLGPGTWGLDTDAGIKRGKTRENGPPLEGLTVGARYRFHCTAEVKGDATGREDTTLYLDNIVLLSENQDENSDA